MPGIMISGNNDKIGTDELLSIINQARLEHGEKPVRNNDFIPRVKDELDGEHYETFVVQNSNGTKSENIVVSNDQAVLIGMRESKAVRRTVLAKLKEKESPLLPQTLPEALRLAADLAEEKIQLENQLAIAAPKAQFVDSYVNASGSLGFREACKLLHIKENAFRQFLIESEIMYLLAGKLTPYAQHIDAGRFTVKTGENQNNGHAFTQNKFTPKGIQWIAGLWAAHQIGDKAA
ncbi:phage antirepressor KilAC domain-containing protein [Citrobacter sp. Cf088]|uniref:phage antirepressor KilAC domain-containing protein n=1 Tax=Citrobacter sp. Cf088 TaxID=2985055 RepID=UPI002575426A|nr:phage antirepressor KilAC domain-containing protein [Citrobacter sp. Cf088]MDM3222451.1 phage antirepressor KilAC domain-containing protein [Citrobacter sp. Cf088]